MPGRYGVGMSTSETPDPLRNEALEDLKKQDIDKLITPDEIVFQGISDPQPTDAIEFEDDDESK